MRTVEPTEQHAVGLVQLSYMWMVLYILLLCKNGVSNGVANLLEVLSVLMWTFQT